jgi:hypothetical protein
MIPVISTESKTIAVHTATVKNKEPTPTVYRLSGCLTGGGIATAVYVFLSCLFIKRSCTTPQENQHTFRASIQSTERLARLVFVVASKRTGEVKEFRRSHVVPFARVSLLPSSTKQRSSNQTSPLSFFRAHHERDNRSQKCAIFPSS